MILRKSNLLFLLILLMFLPFLSTCATVSVDQPYPYPSKFYERSPVFDPQVNDFIKEIAPMPAFKMTMGFSYLRYPIVGVCKYIMDHGGVEIEIDSRYWAIATDMQKKILIFHELGHCVCGRPHDYDGKKYPNPYTDGVDTNKDAYFEDGCPKSIMYPQILIDKCSFTHYDEYIAELKKDCEVD